MGEPRQEPHSSRKGSLWKADHDKQCRNLGKHHHHKQRWTIICRNRDGKKFRNKDFSLVGKIKNTGLVEVPMGITINELFRISVEDGWQGKIKAIQTGGPSGKSASGVYV